MATTFPSLPAGLKPIPNLDGYFCTPGGPEGFPEFWSYKTTGGPYRTTAYRWRRLKTRPGRVRSKWTEYPGVLLNRGKDATGKRLVKRAPLHQLVLAAHVGPRPVGMEARHLDNDWLNPSLFGVDGRVRLVWGTRAENKADQLRGGEAFPNTKLTPEFVREARELWRQGMSCGALHRLGLARGFQVGKNAVLRAVRGKTWAHLK